MNTSIMTLDQIDAHIKQGNHFYVRMRLYKWEGRVTEVVRDKHGEGLHIACKGKYWFGDKNYVVQVNKRIYEIFHSKTDYMKYCKDPKRTEPVLNEIRYNEETDKVEVWNTFFWATLN